jgi:microcystin-dependent protein
MRRGITPILVAFLLLISIPIRTRAQERYLGSVALVSFDFAPKGWALCDGQLLPINQNQALFALLGTTYGGNGINTFALPDLRGRMPIGAGQGNGLSPYALGQIGGEETHTLMLSEIPAHSHTPNGVGSPANTGSVAGTYWATPRILLYSSAAPSVPMNSVAIGSTGGNQPHENKKPYLVITYIIALQGIFPTRN